MSESIPTDDQSIPFDSREYASQYTIELIESARQEICFFGPELYSVLFNNQIVIDKLIAFINQSQRCGIRFLVHGTQQTTAQRHLLIPLAQRLSSKIQIHIADKQDQKSRYMYLLIDNKAFLYCPNSVRYEGIVDFDAVRQVSNRKKDFEDMWSRSQFDLNTRRLQL
jgi:hypothetical protein